MDPYIFTIVVLGAVLALLSLAAGLVWWGRSTRDKEVEALQQDIADRDEEIGSLSETIRELERKRKAQAAGAQSDLRASVSLADAVARDDLDGVLLSFPEDDEEIPPGE